MKFTSYVPQAAQHTLVYGAPKTGKTELVGKLARARKLRIFDLEKGVNTLLKLPTAYHENIELVQVSDSRTTPIAVETMLKVCTGNRVKICDVHGRVNCVACTKLAAEVTWTEVCLNEDEPGIINVLDSATQLSNSVMAFICKAQSDDYQPTYHDYRYQGAVLDRIFGNIQNSKQDWIVISHEVMVTLQDGSEKLVPVGGTSNFSRTFAKYFDHVIYTEVKAKQHKMGSSTTYALNVLTGSRSNLAVEKEGIEGLEALYPPLTNTTTK